MIWLHDVNGSDGLIRPKITYDVSDRLTVWLGADIFYGRDVGLFGQFNGNDRVVSGLRYGF